MLESIRYKYVSLIIDSKIVQYSQALKLTINNSKTKCYRILRKINQMLYKNKR